LGERDLRECAVRFFFPPLTEGDLRECTVRFFSSLSPASGERVG